MNLGVEIIRVEIPEIHDNQARVEVHIEYSEKLKRDTQHFEFVVRQGSGFMLKVTPKKPGKQPTMEDAAKVVDGWLDKIRNTEGQ